MHCIVALQDSSALDSRTAAFLANKPNLMQQAAGAAAGTISTDAETTDQNRADSSTESTAATSVTAFAPVPATPSLPISTFRPRVRNACSKAMSTDVPSHPAATEMQSIEETAEEEDSAFLAALRARHTSAQPKQHHVSVSSPNRDSAAPHLTAINIPPSAGNGGNGTNWLPSWTNTVSVISKPVQCRAVICRQRKMSGVLSTASAIGLSSSVYYERMHRRRSSAVSQASSSSANTRVVASGNELQKIASVSSASSTPQLAVDRQRAGSASNLINTLPVSTAFVSLDSDPSLRSRRATTSAKWLIAPGNELIEVATPISEQPPEDGALLRRLSADIDRSETSDREREQHALLTPMQTIDSTHNSVQRERSLDRKSLTQLVLQASVASKDEVNMLTSAATNAAATPTIEIEKRGPRKIRTVLHQQSTEVAGYKFAYKLSRREALLGKRRVLALFSLCLAMIGLAAVVVESELMVDELAIVWAAKGDLHAPRGINANVTEQYVESILNFKSSWSSQLCKLITCISTLCLLTCIIADRIVLLELFKINNSIADWHLVLTPKWLYKLLLEMAVCGVHPLPFWTGSVMIRWYVLPTPRYPDPMRITPLDIFLTLPMLCRLYLIFRVIVAYSRHTAKASSHSISALNRINVDAKFILKTTVLVYPGSLLLCFIAIFWLVATWCLRLCECFHDAEFLDFSNSAWLTAVTFFSIGYGDIVPTSGCGRSVAILTGLTGAGCIAFVVAVLARKIELSKAELYMHNFLRDMRITNSLKNTAANVLRETWLIHKYSNPEKPRIPQVRFHERKFFHAIQKLRRIKVQQRELMDSATALIDITPLHSQLTAVIDNVQDDQLQIYDKLENLEEKFGQMCTILESLPVAVQNANGNTSNNASKQ